MAPTERPTLKRRRSTAARTRWRRAVALALLALAVAVAGCGDDGTGRDEPAALPDWVENVHPVPGTQTTATQQVQVTHSVVANDEGVRLVVDGTDVTVHASETRPGRLAYDPNRSRAPVELDPGTHEAAVQRVRLDEFGEQHEVLDSFAWEFTVQ